MKAFILCASIVLLLWSVPVYADWWSSLAAVSSGNQQKVATENREEIARRMTPAQNADAQRLAEQCQAHQFKGC